MGGCKCGGFTDSGNLREAILEQVFPGHLVSCDENGAEDCRRKCSRMVNNNIYYYKFKYSYLCNFNKVT